ncbi:Glycerophosphoryl diester phosphodiesterase precursor [Delftia tsuruhatensis]|uniref:glycerophosphodiester phosphodiesterase n=1 Tax=Delftia tsuruhatensis TaxID=180282 RepID=UPI001E766630|nr:glycerophosphodiester phosphodiesterase [Delftia tsuruhatensis]CAB5706151.1 Glycerophosphoryl diester phosphodiesterase precursor [Delftia tsuruhatensis]CAC9693876.1 Glycerophosphoryl diester phosphodiesterase precursor [Delftia tsuruhatensis]
MNRFPRRRTLALAGAAAGLLLAGCAAPRTADPKATAADWPPRPALIAHRGASALRPEHTLEAYREAIRAGADFIEPDLVITRDGVLVARHENAIAILAADGSVKEATTDVADRPEFAARKATKTIDGQAITGWFTEDFTLAELKTLRARERIPALRPANARFNDRFEVPTLQEVIDLAKSESARTGRTVGIYPETKHPTYFQSIGLPLEPALLKVLADNGWNHAQAPVFVQSFEVENLRWIRARSSLRLVQLLAPRGKPHDSVARGHGPGYADMATPAGLAGIARYANGIGPGKSMVIPLVQGANAAPTSLVADAHRAGLLVHPWTLRPENAFLPQSLKSAPVGDGARRGNARADMDDFLRAGIDGIFTDDPSVGRAAIDALLRTRP